MAKIEPNRIVASSLDNFLIFENPSYQEMPYVTIGVTSGNTGKTISLVFSDKNDDDAQKIEIEGKPGANISSRSFNTTGSVTQVMLALMECLKLNTIVYDVQLATANSLKMGLDTSRQWKITSQLSIGGNYASYDPEAINKWTVMMNGRIDDNVSQLSMSKYNNNQTVSFNITAPFQYITTKFPFNVNLSAYALTGNVVRVETINNPQILVLPTTLDKFDEVDYEEYYSDSSDNEKKKFLTRSPYKKYNYGEYVGLSLLTNRTLSSVSLIKKYYTNSGMFLTSKTGAVYKELNNSRLDFYDTFDILSVENAYNHQVGYIDVVAVNGTTEITEPMRFYVEPKCDDNDTLFFVNSIGGIDSFTFLGEHKFTAEIDENTTYMSNPEKPFGDTYELEYVKQKAINETYSSTSNMIREDLADWLTELQRSKYVFKFLGTEDPKFKIVIVDKMDIELSDNSKYYEIEVQYHYADSKINI